MDIELREEYNRVLNSLCYLCLRFCVSNPECPVRGLLCLSLALAAMLSASYCGVVLWHGLLCFILPGCHAVLCCHNIVLCKLLWRRAVLEFVVLKISYICIMYVQYLQQYLYIMCVLGSNMCQVICIVLQVCIFFFFLNLSIYSSICRSICLSICISSNIL